MRFSKLLETAIAKGKTSYKVPAPDKFKAKSSSMKEKNILVKYRKGDIVRVWAFVQGDGGVDQMAYAVARRNWKQDPLSRDVFAVVEIESVSKKYENMLIDLVQEIVYPVAIRDPQNKYKKISKSSGSLFKSSFTVKKFEKKFKIKLL